MSSHVGSLAEVQRDTHVRLAEIRCTSSRGPCIWSGRTVGGRIVLIVFRRGVLSVRVAALGETVVDAGMRAPVFERVVDEVGTEGPMPPRELVYQCRSWPITWPPEFGAS